MKNKNIYITLASSIFCLLLGFAFGSWYQSTKRPAFNRANIQGNFQRNGVDMGARNNTGANQQNRGGFRPLTGEITNQDEKTITLKSLDGSSKIVLLSSETQINKAQTATIGDLVTGEKVSIFGTQNPDGSITAQSIQLNPPMPSNSPTDTMKK